MPRKTMLCDVRPIRGSRFGWSIVYRYRGRALRDASAEFWNDAARDAALCYASRHGFTRITFAVLPDWGASPLVSTTELATVRLPDSGEV